MNSQTQKNIVVVGGGFAGVAAIKELLRHKKEINANITLIDKNPYHLFTPSLYEVATSEEPQKNIAIPFSELFGNSISYVEDTVKCIDVQKQSVVANTTEVHYDYLILCSGSQPAYHHIPGLKQYSISLKSLGDAMEIKNKITLLCTKEDILKKKVQIIIGGGGFSGTELAAELLTYRNHLTQQHSLTKDCLEVTIIQGSRRLLKELDVHVSKVAQKRLKDPYVHFAFGGHIQEVTNEMIITDNGKSYPYDFIIWTGGVEASELASQSGLVVNKRGQVVADKFLQVSKDIYAAGDIAGFINPQTQVPVPNVAQVAEEQGATAGKNVYLSLIHKPLSPYQFRHWGYIVPLKGKYATAELMGWFHFDGYLGWVLQQLVFLRYLLSILPVWKAFRKWNTFEVHLKQ